MRNVDAEYGHGACGWQLGDCKATGNIERQRICGLLRSTRAPRAKIGTCRDARAWERAANPLAQSSKQLTTTTLGNTTRDAAYGHRPQHDGMGALHIFTRQLHGYLMTPPHVEHLTPQGTSLRHRQGATEK